MHVLTFMHRCSPWLNKYCMLGGNADISPAAHHLNYSVTSFQDFFFLEVALAVESPPMRHYPL